MRRSIGVALQEAALDPLMTGRELMQLQATLHGIPRADGERRATALLDAGRPDAGRRPPRRHLLGRHAPPARPRDGAHARPEVLFLDEPTTGLDPVSRRAIWEEVRRLNDEGTTVFLTTQYLEEADQLADRVGIIDEGRMAAEGTPAALKAQVGQPHLELTLADGGAEQARRGAGPLRRARCPRRTAS